MSLVLASGLAARLATETGLAALVEAAAALVGARGPDLLCSLAAGLTRPDAELKEFRRLFDTLPPSDIQRELLLPLSGLREPAPEDSLPPEGPTPGPEQPEPKDELYPADWVGRYLSEVMPLRRDAAAWRQGRLPSYFPILPERQLRAYITALLARPRPTGEIDTIKVVNAVASRRFPHRLATRQRLSLARGAAIYLDAGVGMQLFARDTRRFADQCRRILGPQRCRLLTIDPDGGIPALPEGIAVALLLTDGHAFAHRHSYLASGLHNWHRLAQSARACRTRLIALCPGAATGEVPRFAAADLIGRPHAPIRAVPWHEGLTLSQATSYATGRRLATSRDHLALIGRLRPDRGLDRLLALISAQQDLDAASLRALRLCLVDPARVARGLNLSADETDALPPAAFPNLGPLDELALWTSRFIEIRDGRGAFSDRIEEARQLRRANHTEWDRLLPFASKVSMHMRAGRGLVELVGDRWQRDRLAVPFPEGAREALAVTLKAIKEADKTAARVWQVTGRRGAGRQESIIPSDDRGMFLCLKASDGGRLLYLAEGLTDCDLKIRLPPGCDLAEGRLAIWDRDAREPTATHRLWPLDRYIEIAPPATGDLPSTLAITVGGSRYFMNLTARRTKLEPLFTRVVPRGPRGALRFLNGRLMLGRWMFDIEGLKLLNPEADQDHSDLPSGRMAEGGRLIASDGLPPEGSERSIDLPRVGSRTVSPIKANGDNAIALAKDRAWTVTHDPGGDEGACTIVEWVIDAWRQDKADSLGTENVALATSGLGGLVALRGLPESGTALLLLDPREKTAQRFLLRSDPDAVAMDDAGYVAVLDGSRIEIYQPLASLPSGEVGLATPMAEPALKNIGMARHQGSTTAKWYPVKEHDVEATIEALGSRQWEAASRIWRFATAGLDRSRIPPERIAAAHGLGAVDARLISACLGPDPEADEILQALQDGANVNLRLPGGLTPLYLSCLLPQPLEAVEVLLAAGAKVDEVDTFGRAPLYNAAFAKDSGRTLERLLDAGADPRRVAVRKDPTGGKDDISIGVLATAMFLSPDRPGECPPESLILRLHKGGASWTAFGNASCSSALTYAATRSPRLFDLALMHDGRVDHQDDDGWSPLLVAAWAGNTHAVRKLIDRKAMIDLALPTGETALSLAAGNGHAEVTELLLVAGADPNGRQSDQTPLDRLVASSEDRPDPETAVRIATQLVEHDAAFDRAAIFREALLYRWLDARKRSRARAIAEMLCRNGKSGLLVDSLARANHLPGKDWLADFLELGGLDLDAAGAQGLKLVHVLAALHLSTGAVFERLEQAGADLLAQDDHGNSPLHYAVLFENQENAAALRRLRPRIEHLRRKDGLLANDLRSLPPTRGFAAPPQADFPRPPSDDALAALSYLPTDTPWIDLLDRAAPTVRTAGLPRPSLPFGAATIDRWSMVALRQAPLPYREPTFLREAWWRRGDGALAVGAEVVTQEGETLFAVRGMASDIHAINPAAARELQIASPEAAAQYLRFFCHVTHGKDGPFFLTESDRALRWFGLRNVPRYDPSMRQDAREKRWIADRMVAYDGKLFQCTFGLAYTGEAKMLEDTPVEEGTFSRTFLADGRLFGFASPSRAD